MDTLRVMRWQSPVGEMQIGAVGESLCMADWTASGKHEAVVRSLCRRLRVGCREEATPLAQLAIDQLGEYFRGERTVFSLPLRLAGTDFQLRAWEALRRIPYASTLTYGEQARRMGCAESVRAVAAANGRNPLSIIVPCHRVVGAGGRLTGYAGGLAAKAALLRLEALRSILADTPDQTL